MRRRTFNTLLVILLSYFTATIVSDLIVEGKSRSILELEIETSEAGVWQLFWSRDEQLDQEDSIRESIGRPGKRTITYPLNNKKIRVLRLDPGDGSVDRKVIFAIQSIRLYNGFGTIYKKRNTEDIIPLNSTVSKIDNNRFAVTGPDPQLRLDFANLLFRRQNDKHIAALWIWRILIFLLCNVVTFGTLRFLGFSRWGKALSTVFIRSVRLLPFLTMGGVIASVYGFINGFPLIFSDTGMYLRSGIEWFVPDNRPIMYGIFLAFTSYKSCLWIPIIVQGMFITYCCYLLLENLLNDKSNLQKLTLILVLILSLFTSLSWFSSQLLPDIFCAIAAFALILLFLDKSKYVSRKIALTGIFLICNLSHTSSLLISLGMSGFLLVATIIFRKHLDLKRAVIPCALAVLSFPLLMTLNYTISGKFRTSENSYVFMSAKLAELGLLQKYLRENPDGENYQLATMVDDIEESIGRFIWNPESVTRRLPRTQLKAELTKINRNILSDPPSLVYFTWKGVQQSVTLFFTGTLRYGLHSYRGKYVHDIIKEYYPHAETSFLNSMQQRWAINDRLNHLANAVLLWVSYVSIPVLLLTYRKRLPLNVSVGCISIFFAVALNDFICATLSTDAPRYHARISWMVVAALFCLTLKLLESREQKTAQD